MSEDRPLKFSEATLVPNRRDQQPKYKSPACIEAAQSYTANIERSDRLAAVPGFSFMWGEYWIASIDEAIEERENPNESEADLFVRAQGIYFNIPYTKPAEEAQDDLYRAKSNIEITFSRTPVFRETLSALLEAMIIQAWTTYETMAEDLHKFARRDHPNRFTQEIRDKKYRFRSEDSLTYSYKYAFNDAAINAAVWNSESKALAMLRHLLIHQGGIVDDQFIKQCAGQNKHGTPIGMPVVTEFLAYKETDRIPIDGVFARSLIDRLVAAGYKLLSAVDDWLK